MHYEVNVASLQLQLFRTLICFSIHSTLIYYNQAIIKTPHIFIDCPRLMGSFLGQNFLTDQRVIHAIVQEITQIYQNTQAKAIVEIGPGKGAITQYIHTIAPHFVAIEKDKLMYDHLRRTFPNTYSFYTSDPTLSHQKQYPQACIVQGDALEVDVYTLIQHLGVDPSETLIVGNFPYYITSPLIRKFWSGHQSRFAGGVCMIQHDVADKLHSDAKKKSYLRWLTNFAHQVRYWKTVPPSAFTPAPKVQSGLLSFSALTQAHGDRDMYLALQDLLENLTPYKRKTLRKIRKILGKKGIKTPMLPDTLASHRLENLTRQDIQIILHS